KGSSSEILIKKYPKIALCAVRLIKDKDALPGLAKIIDDQERLIQYAGAMISTILLAILLKRYFYLPGRSVQEAVGFWFLRFLIIFFLRIGILYSFYSSELAATFKVVTKTFF
ncbi:MAG: hypothetical protein Q7U04_10290, partial [Bacteriovorax sp.]|nr:hypothetical protein [Bacteriovorax sp.]